MQRLKGKTGPVHARTLVPRHIRVRGHNHGRGLESCDRQGSGPQRDNNCVKREIQITLSTMQLIDLRAENMLDPRNFSRDTAVKREDQRKEPEGLTVMLRD